MVNLGGGTIDSRRTASYVKGAAILLIVIDHYALHYFSRFATRYDLAWLGYGLASIFFVISGNGIMHSLQRRLSESRLTPRLAARFYLDRALRIYPLYFLALLVTPHYNTDMLMLGHLDYRSLNIYLASPFVSGPNFFWFVHCLVQCYLLAPFLFLLFKRLGIRLFLWINLALIMMSSVTTFIFFAVAPQAGAARLLNAFVIQPNLAAGLFCGNIFLFALGMLIPSLLAEQRNRFNSRPALVLAVAGLTAITLTMRFGHFEVRSLLSPLLLFSLMLVCLFALGTRPRLPFPRLVSTVGDYSLPVYLFHIAFFVTLGQAGIVHDGSFLSAGIALISLPAFLIYCIYVEKGLQLLRRGFARQAVTQA